MLSPSRTSPTKFQACCPVCGESYVRNRTGRHRKFCSDQCRDRARPDRKLAGALKNGAHYPYSAEPRNDAKSPCGPRTNFQKNGGRPPDIRAPRRVIEAEIGGRGWIEIISTDGVRSFMRAPSGKAVRHD
jgi:hypothetical protein